MVEPVRDLGVQIPRAAEGIKLESQSDVIANLAVKSLKDIPNRDSLIRLAQSLEITLKIRDDAKSPKLEEFDLVRNALIDYYNNLNETCLECISRVENKEEEEYNFLTEDQLEFLENLPKFSPETDPLAYNLALRKFINQNKDSALMRMALLESAELFPVCKMLLEEGVQPFPPYLPGKDQKDPESVSLAWVTLFTKTFTDEKNNHYKLYEYVLKKNEIDAKSLIFLTWCEDAHKDDDDAPKVKELLRLKLEETDRNVSRLKDSEKLALLKDYLPFQGRRVPTKFGPDSG